MLILVTDVWCISCEIAIRLMQLGLGAVRQQVITWTKVDLDPCRHMASLGHNELMQRFLIWTVIVLVQMAFFVVQA